MSRRLCGSACVLAVLLLAACGRADPHAPPLVRESLSNIVTNLGNSGSYVSVSFTAVLRGGADKWTAAGPAVRAAVLTVLRNETPSGLSGGRGEARLAQALKQAIATVVPTVKTVYITNLVVD